jgi:hypothetical protein
MNSPRLRPYHNPDNVDESYVPSGWRFSYEGERLHRDKTVRVWLFFGFATLGSDWKQAGAYTYIVPVA